MSASRRPRTLLELDQIRIERKAKQEENADDRPPPPVPRLVKSSRDRRPSAALIAANTMELSRFKLDPPAYLRERYVDRGDDMLTIGADLGVSRQRVHQLMQRYDIRRPASAKNSARVIELIKGGKTVEEVAAELEIKPQSVQTYLREHAPTLPRSVRPAAWKRPPKEWLEEHYVKQGPGAPTIAKLLLTYPHTVYDWLGRYGIQTRPRPTTTSNVTAEWLLEEFAAKRRTTIEIAEEVGCSPSRISQLLARFKIKLIHGRRMEWQPGNSARAGGRTVRRLRPDGCVHRRRSLLRSLRARRWAPLLLPPLRRRRER